ncbi:unnamed protein product [Caenorhabditis angaria]|uniref:glutathione transferase n=1 Tax=Caenorhabditis angaria TaxID=860376 RepID=A0A9P1MVL1_9PELO|nr:unnamed protein product [Caenorhabditis angaria]
MVKYILTYFEVRGYAEAARQVFHLAGVEFEDRRVTHDQWNAEIKEGTTLGKLPILQVDGFEIPQSQAITRYLARKFGFAGKTPEEQAWVDAIADQFKDFAGPFREYIVAERLGKPTEEVARIRAEVSVPAVESFVALLTNILSKSKSGFLVGDNVTFADLILADILVTLQKNGFINNESKYEKVLEHQKRVHNLPGLKNYIETRPDTQF